MKHAVFLLLFTLLFLSNKTKAQCSIASTNGWTVTVNINPTAVIPEFNPCPTYYHYEIRFNYTITFTGSTSNRNFNANAYFTCTGGTGGNIYQPLGNFTGNASGTMTTSNNSRQYNAPYSSTNPSCSAVTLAHTNCTSVRLDYWGSGTIGSSINCPLSAAPLPIELLSFEAIPKNNYVELTWATLSETNNQFFAIERSIDALEWKEISRQDGAGNSIELREYATTDKQPENGISYYRLKQVDYNGAFKYSPVVVIDLSDTDNSGFIAFPVPADQTITICGKEIPEEVSILNTLGQKLNVPIENLTNCAKLSTTGIPAGIYNMVIKHKNTYISKKVIVVHQ